MYSCTESGAWIQCHAPGTVRDRVFVHRERCVNTGSCTDKNDPNPWWAVDLGQAYHVAYVTVTMPVFGGNYRNYPLFVHLFIRYNDYRICKTQSVFLSAKIFCSIQYMINHSARTVSATTQWGRSRSMLRWTVHVTNNACITGSTNLGQFSLVRAMWTRLHLSLLKTLVLPVMLLKSGLRAIMVCFCLLFFIFFSDAC